MGMIMHCIFTQRARCAIPGLAGARRVQGRARRLGAMPAHHDLNEIGRQPAIRKRWQLSNKEQTSLFQLALRAGMP